MTVAERMRRDGWTFDDGDWVNRIAGVYVVVYQDNNGYGYFETHVNETNGECWYPCWRRVGIRDLAQRAKSAARRLARKGRKP